MARLTKARMAELEQIKKRLREIVKPGMTVYTIVVHASRSGMYRVIKMVVIKDNRPVDISYDVGRLLEGYDDRHGGAKASGYGMDMGFQLVYSLGMVLYPDAEENRTFNVMTYRDGSRVPETIGGYLLKHSWM